MGGVDRGPGARGSLVKHLLDWSGPALHHTLKDDGCCGAMRRAALSFLRERRATTDELVNHILYDRT
ncbi:MAG: hypothetical protein CMJ88_08295 [Planctomycetes bacterium]|nr:hypothetical protein [Planctomycetota bacterium]